MRTADVVCATFAVRLNPDARAGQPPFRPFFVTGVNILGRVHFRGVPPFLLKKQSAARTVRVHTALCCDAQWLFLKNTVVFNKEAAGITGIEAQEWFERIGGSTGGYFLHDGFGEVIVEQFTKYIQCQTFKNLDVH